MGAMSSQITSIAIVYSTVYSGADKKHQSSVSLAFLRGIHGSPVNSPHNTPHEPQNTSYLLFTELWYDLSTVLYNTSYNACKHNTIEINIDVCFCRIEVTIVRRILFIDKELAQYL